MSSEGVLPVTLLRTERELPFAFPADELFGGWLKSFQEADLSHWWWLPLGLLLLALASRLLLSQRPWRIVSLASISIVSVALSFRVVEGWDELFIGAKTARSLVVAGRYSYNVSSMQEASGDFLPILLSGLLGMLGLPLTETYLSVCVFGSVLLAIAVWRLAEKLTDRDAAGTFLITLGVCVLPCVLFTGAAGFFSTFFAAMLLFTVELVFFAQNERERRVGFALAAILTLFRMEGIIFAFFVWLTQAVFAERRALLSAGSRIAAAKRVAIAGMVLAGPFVAACAARFIAFGHPLPAPAALKNSQGDPAFIEAGVKYLRHVTASFHIVEIALLLVPLLALAMWWHRDRWAGKLSLVWMLLIAFSVPYVGGGGDWFPHHWARYLIPVIVFTYVALWALAFRLMKSVFPRFGIAALSIVALAVAPYALKKSHLPIARENAYVMLSNVVRTPSFRWQRINALGYFGWFIRETTEPSALIASPEEATLMYFAERDALDLTGFAHPDVAYSRSQPFKPGDIMHRKRNPGVIKKHLPEIIAFWEMTTTSREPYAIITDDEAREHAFKLFGMYFFTTRQQNVSYYRAGSYGYLQRLGYRYLLIQTPKSVFAYLVSERAYESHLQRLASLGFHEIARREVQYKVDSDVASRFSSGEELLDVSQSFVSAGRAPE